jgi:hypothetical protein
MIARRFSRSKCIRFPTSLGGLQDTVFAGVSQRVYYLRGVDLMKANGGCGGIKVEKPGAAGSPTKKVLQLRRCRAADAYVAAIGSNPAPAARSGMQRGELGLPDHPAGNHSSGIPLAQLNGYRDRLRSKCFTAYRPGASTADASVPAATAQLGSSAQPRRTCRLLVPPSAQAAGLRGCAQLGFSWLGEAMRLHQSATMG